MSKIEWTNKTWNPTTGCNKVSQGCKNCYAETMHKRLQGMGQPKYKQDFNKGVVCHDSELSYPLTIRKPTMFFVNSMSDLFHADVPFTFIDSVFDYIDACPQHTFQILTKRPERMKRFFDWKRSGNGFKFDQDIWPLPNVWLGTSVEDKPTADDRILYLLQTPAAIRFLSCEPLLGPIDLWHFSGNTIFPQYAHFNAETNTPQEIDWVIVGGESGPNARPMHPDWVRSLRDQCAAAKVPFFFKQWGEYLPFEPTAQPPFYSSAATGEEYDGHGMNHIDPETGDAGKWKGSRWYDPFNGSILCEETQSRDCTFLKTGKKESGHLLDGKTHREFPTLQPIQQ